MFQKKGNGSLNSVTVTNYSSAAALKTMQEKEAEVNAKHLEKVPLENGNSLCS